MYDEIIWTSKDENQRIRAVEDMDPHEPYDDGAMITLQVLNRYGNPEVSLVRGHYGLGVPTEKDKPWPTGVPDFESIYKDLAQRITYGWDAEDHFFRYLRAFHGTTTFYTYGPTPYTDYTYLTFDTAAWREKMGYLLPANPKDAAIWKALAAYHGSNAPSIARALRRSPTSIEKGLERLEALGLVEKYHYGYRIKGGAEDDFTEYGHYLEGNTWGIVHEHKIEVHTDTRDYVTEEWKRGAREDRWEEQESVWGFYTDDMKELATNALWQFGLDKEDGK